MFITLLRNNDCVRVCVCRRVCNAVCVCVCNCMYCVHEAHIVVDNDKGE